VPLVSDRRTDDMDETPRAHVPIWLVALQLIASRHCSSVVFLSAAGALRYTENTKSLRRPIYSRNEVTSSEVHMVN
jgi:hypothetical protein